MSTSDEIRIKASKAFVRKVEWVNRMSDLSNLEGEEARLLTCWIDAYRAGYKEGKKRGKNE